jgi:hypothetical protein
LDPRSDETVSEENDISVGDALVDEWAGVIDMLTMYPDARRLAE